MSSLAKITLPLFVCTFHVFFAQEAFTVPPSSLFYGLKAGDSIVIYQCRVVDPAVDRNPAVSALPAPCTVTEKIVLKSGGENLTAILYTTHLRDLPNRKFSGLKIRERPYWLFTRSDTLYPDKAALEKLVRLELAGREAMEYDYPVTKHTRNQVIFKRGKNFKQLIYDKPVAALGLLR